MPIDLTGIYNENEFYTHHYLSAILENDLKDLFKEWQRREEEEGKRQPKAKLKSLARDFFGLRSQLERERKPEVRLELQREFHAKLLPALGYDFHPDLRELDEGVFLPLLGEVRRSSGAPELWIIEALAPTSGEDGPLSLAPCECQYDEDRPLDRGLKDMNLEEIVTRKVFGLSEPPRWVLLASDSQLVLLERAKWTEKRLLRFDLGELFERRESSALAAAAALLHRESVAPADGLGLLDTLDENSHRHAFAVSQDLKYALRECVELLGNEAIWDLRERLKEKIYGRDLAAQLSRESLRYMYRLLFLFYIEARPELGYAPMKAEAYREGYSLESLRDLELIRLDTAESREGHYIHESLQILFRLIHEGYPSASGDRPMLETGPEHHTFRIPPLRSHLFDPARTHLLNKVKFRNCVLREIIEKMSLSRETRGGRRGRISYAQLGINQLGAVYESLLSYSGFFAETDLYEVKRAGEPYDELETAYFVRAEDLPKYTEEEQVLEDGRLKMHPKGSFIYRLAGRDREKSASYYTPESLTRCLVKYALKELLQDKTADEILDLTICEPAMGSAAFLNEAVNQLAEEYLRRKQSELGQTIPHEDYAQEQQKVKMFIADNRVHGVDLNPVAVELAEVSLWLNTIYEGAYVPWFGLQIVRGNSLVGARRQVYASRLLKKTGKSSPLWLDEVPERVMPGEVRKKGQIYHFLLPDRSMADYKDKVVKAMAEQEFKLLKEWRKDFTAPYSESDIKELERLSEAVDKLWARHVKKLQEIRRKTSDPLHVFGQPESKNMRPPTTTEWKDQVLQGEFYSEGVRASSPYRRLKMVMDYWCALWFWPIEKANLLPSRYEFMLEIAALLTGNVYEANPLADMPLFALTAAEDELRSEMDELGFVNVPKLCEQFERLKLVKELGEKYGFLHWELEFADVFEERGGFDLVVGNPPWIKVEWNEGGVLGDVEPLFVLRHMSASDLAKQRAEVIERQVIKSGYLAAFEESESVQNFLNAEQNYPLLKGSQSNLYKCFVPQAWMLAKREGVSAFLHPDGIYDDPKCGRLRQAIYRRLRAHFQFQNELSLFRDVDHHARFSINVYSNNRERMIGFAHISNLFYPPTIDACFEHNGIGVPPGIKDDAGNWSVSGHRARIIKVTEEELSLFARLYDEPETLPIEARLSSAHSKQVIEVLKKFAHYPQRLADLRERYFSTEMWHETNSQKDGTIRRETRFPDSLNELILSGPHFYVGNPLYKTPRNSCIKNSDYDIIDLTDVPYDYMPRTNYTPSCEYNEYIRRTARVSWESNSPVTNHFRLICRGMLQSGNERTLIGALYPPGVSHIHGCKSHCFNFSDERESVLFSGCTFSIPFEFITKSTGRSNLHQLLEIFPVPLEDDSSPQLILRCLLLSCITQSYAPLWSRCWDTRFKTSKWAKVDPRLPSGKFSSLSPDWTWHTPLRTDYERRQALVEIDVLTAMALSLTLDELKTIYRIQFPVMRGYEADTWYDQSGRIVFTASKGLPGVGFSRKEWEEIKGMESGAVSRTIIDDTQPGGPRERTITYVAPFDRCDREKDYELAWAEFERRFSQAAQKGAA